MLEEIAQSAENRNPDSVTTSGPSASDSRFAGLWAHELESAPAPLPWLWEGYLAPGNLTLLTSPWKSGKTTLVSVLLAKLKEGGTLAGQAVRPGTAAVVSEEAPQLWQGRRRKLGFGDVCFYCRPFRGRPALRDWQELLEHLAGLRARRGLDLVVIDPLAPFFPGGAENIASAMMDVLLPLRDLAAGGTSALVPHHPRRKESPAGQTARGSGALPSYADVLIELGACGPAGGEGRRRRLQGFSRYQETPRDRVIELTADGTDYACLGDFEDAAFADDWQALRAVLWQAPRPLTVRELVREWPPAEAPPAEATLWRRLARALEEGRVCRAGAGRRGEPYRYALPGMTEEWDRRRREEISRLADGT